MCRIPRFFGWLKLFSFFANLSSSESESLMMMSLTIVGSSDRSDMNCRESEKLLRLLSSLLHPIWKGLSWVDVEALGTRCWYSSAQELSLVFGQVSITRPGHEDEWEISLLGDNDRICSQEGAT
ncbi:transport protein [Sesbania bispinosa]|nr:transport protein [Sesbania bispinosa]